MEKRHLRPKRRWHFALILAIVITLLLVVGVCFAAPPYLKQKIESAMSEGCPRCEFQIGSMELNPLTGQVVADNVTYVSDPHGSTLFKVKLGKLEALFDVSKLIENQYVLDHLELTRLSVIIEEAANPHPAKPDPEVLRKIESSYGGKFLESLPEATVEKLILKDSRLEYVLRVFKKNATITVSDINAEISKIGTRRELAPRFNTAHLTGRVQRSGSLDFHLKADLFSVKNEDEVELEIKHLPMIELDTFFTKEDGIEMNGDLNLAHAKVFLHQGLLTGEMDADYKNLVIHLKTTPNAGPIKVLFENIFEKLKTAKTKPAPHEPPPRSVVDYKRKPGESVVNFILQGLKEAAFKVIAN